ncbi:galactose-1-epimerase [Aquipuribacter hungaricus]|uniref:Aldose 1-epimerase n=1 Tax=Aquipuribacter hungaricus TaxID=545624 RepID=A0ABV7WJ12_9MICO
MPSDLTTVTRTPFGTTPDGRDVDRYELVHGQVTVAVITYGGVLQSVRVPDRDGVAADVVLGYDDLAGYVADTSFHGALVGRFGNRIAGASFTLDGTEHHLPQNYGTATLHGGPGGFHAQVWDAQEVDGGVRLSLVSPDGQEGFPGTVEVEVTVTLGEAGLRWDYRATTDAPTVLNLTNHAYWNLGGTGAGTVEHHVLRAAAGRYVPVDEGLLPLPDLAAVDGTPFDFREPTRLGARLRTADEQLLRAQGYDHCLLFDTWRDSLAGTREAWSGEPGGLPEVVRAEDPRSGRTLTLRTDQPGVQLYSGNFLDGTVVGRGGVTFRQGDGFCLETQHLPDSPNRPDFPSTVLRPGQEYVTSTTVSFGTV